MKKRFLPTLFSTLILLFALSTCEKSENYHLKYADTKSPWVKEVKELLALDSLETYPDDAILFMGSSSIRMWKTIHEDMRPYSTIRRGYGGAKYSDLIHFTEEIVANHKLSGVAIFVANDIRNQPDDKSPEEVLGLFKANVRLIRKYHANIPIFSIAVTPTPSRWAAWDKISQSNHLIQSYCEATKNLYYIDTVSGFLTENNQPDSSLFLNDMLHQNAAGYAIWTSKIKAKIQQVIPKK